MSCRELIESLKRGADESISLLWQDAEAEAGRIRAELARELTRLRDEERGKRDVLARERIAQAVSEADRRARNLRLGAEKMLSERLYSLAAEHLAALRKDGYEALFEVLAREIPPISWQTVRVNPADAGLAGKFFPNAEIREDPDITGGMDVSTRNDAIRVVNTFEKRLERAWSDLLPLMIEEACHEISDDASSSGPGGPGVPGGIPAGKDQRETVPPDH